MTVVKQIWVNNLLCRCILPYDPLPFEKDDAGITYADEGQIRKHVSAFQPSSAVILCISSIGKNGKYQCTLSAHIMLYIWNQWL